eukprot:jgi/Chlat1/2330/Chrsp17S02611
MAAAVMDVVVAEPVQANGTIFKRIGDVRASAPEELAQFQPPDGAARLLAVSNRFGVTVCGDAAACYAAYTADLVALAQKQSESKERATADAAKDKLVRVPVSGAVGLGFSANEEVLCVAATNRLRFYHMYKLLVEKCEEPYATLEVAESNNSIREFCWNPIAAEQFLLTTGSGVLKVGTVAKGVTATKADVLTSSWSPDGSFVAFAHSRHVVTIASPQLNTLHDFCLPEWADREEDTMVRIDSLYWHESNRLLIGAVETSIVDDNAEDMNCPLAVLQSESPLSTPTSKEAARLVALEGLCPSIDSQSMPPGTGPYLHSIYVSGLKTAVVANRKSSDDHINLVAFGSDVHGLEVDADYIPRIQMTAEEEDNFVVGLAIDHTQTELQEEDPRDKSGQTLLKPTPLLLAIAQDGTLSLFSFSSPDGSKLLRKPEAIQRPSEPKAAQPESPAAYVPLLGAPAAPKPDEQLVKRPPLEFPAKSTSTQPFSFALPAGGKPSPFGVIGPGALPSQSPAPAPFGGFGGYPSQPPAQTPPVAPQSTPQSAPFAFAKSKEASVPMPQTQQPPKLATKARLKEQPPQKASEPVSELEAEFEETLKQVRLLSTELDDLVNRIRGMGENQDAILQDNRAKAAVLLLSDLKASMQLVRSLTQDKNTLQDKMVHMRHQVHKLKGHIMQDISQVEDVRMLWTPDPQHEELERKADLEPSLAAQRQFTTQSFKAMKMRLSEVEAHVEQLEAAQRQKRSQGGPAVMPPAARIQALYNTVNTQLVVARNQSLHLASLMAQLGLEPKQRSFSLQKPTATDGPLHHGRHREKGLYIKFQQSEFMNEASPRVDVATSQRRQRAMDRLLQATRLPIEVAATASTPRPYAAMSPPATSKQPDLEATSPPAERPAPQPPAQQSSAARPPPPQARPMSPASSAPSRTHAPSRFAPAPGQPSWPSATSTVERPGSTAAQNHAQPFPFSQAPATVSAGSKPQAAGPAPSAQPAFTFPSAKPLAVQDTPRAELIVTGPAAPFTFQCPPAVTTNNKPPQMLPAFGQPGTAAFPAPGLIPPAAFNARRSHFDEETDESEVSEEQSRAQRKGPSIFHIEARAPPPAASQQSDETEEESEADRQVPRKGPGVFHAFQQAPPPAARSMFSAAQSAWTMPASARGGLSFAAVTPATPPTTAPAALPEPTPTSTTAVQTSATASSMQSPDAVKRPAKPATAITASPFSYGAAMAFPAATPTAATAFATGVPATSSGAAAPSTPPKATTASPPLFGAGTPFSQPSPATETAPSAPASTATEAPAATAIIPVTTPSVAPAIANTEAALIASSTSAAVATTPVTTAPATISTPAATAAASSPSPVTSHASQPAPSVAPSPFTASAAESPRKPAWSPAATEPSTPQKAATAFATESPFKPAAEPSTPPKPAASLDAFKPALPLWGQPAIAASPFSSPFAAVSATQSPFGAASFAGTAAASSTQAPTHSSFGAPSSAATATAPSTPAPNPSPFAKPALAPLSLGAGALTNSATPAVSDGFGMGALALPDQEDEMDEELEEDESPKPSPSMPAPPLKPAAFAPSQLAPTSQGFGSTGSVFGAGQSSSSTFGFGTQSAPAFGAPASSFGQPSAFGQPSGFGQAAAPQAFGQSVQPGAGFGQAAALVPPVSFGGAASAAPPAGAAFASYSGQTSAGFGAFATGGGFGGFAAASKPSGFGAFGSAAQSSSNRSPPPDAFGGPRR